MYKDETGDISGVILAARNIADEKRFENELTEAKKNAEIATQKAEEATKLKEREFGNKINRKHLINR